jgi:hypothetical protein
MLVWSFTYSYYVKGLFKLCNFINIVLNLVVLYKILFFHRSRVGWMLFTILSIEIKIEMSTNKNASQEKFSFIEAKAIVCHTKRLNPLKDKFNDYTLFLRSCAYCTTNSNLSLSLPFDVRFIFLSSKCRNLTTRCIYEV